MQGTIYPDVRVGMRLVRQMPTVVMKGEERIETPNPSIYIYDTSGPYSDENVSIDLEKGLPRLREAWIRERAEKDADNIGQMYYAKKGIITPEMEYVAIRENMNCKELGIESHITPEFVRREVAEGRAVIPANVNHPESEPRPQAVRNSFIVVSMIHHLGNSISLLHLYVHIKCNNCT